MKHQILIYILIVFTSDMYAQVGTLNGLCFELNTIEFLEEQYNSTAKDKQFNQTPIQICFSKSDSIEIENIYFHGKIIYTQDFRFLEIINYSSNDTMRVYNMFDSYCWAEGCASSYLNLVYRAGNYIIREITDNEDWIGDIVTNQKIIKYAGSLMSFLNDIKKEKMLVLVDNYSTVWQHFILNKTINAYISNKQGITDQYISNIDTIKFYPRYYGVLIFDYDKNYCQIINAETKDTMRILYDFDMLSFGGGIEGTFNYYHLQTNGGVLSNYQDYRNASVFIFIPGNFIVKEPVVFEDWKNYEKVPDRIVKVERGFNEILKRE